MGQKVVDSTFSAAIYNKESAALAYDGGDPPKDSNINRNRAPATVTASVAGGGVLLPLEPPRIHHPIHVTDVDDDDDDS